MAAGKDRKPLRGQERLGADVCSAVAFHVGGWYGAKRKEEHVMATSSIFADFEIKDPKAVRVFVDALCSDKSWPQPKVKVNARHLSSPAEIRKFFAKRKSARATAAK